MMAVTFAFALKAGKHSVTRGSGQALTERRMADRPQYADYVARTSGFIPRPPKRSAAGAGPAGRG